MIAGAVTKLYSYDSAADTTPGAHVAADLDNSNGAINTHGALTAAHGATGANVGTTNSQTLTNKTLSGAVVSVALTTVAMKREAVTTTATLGTDTVIAGITAIGSSYTITIPTASITTNAGRIWVFKDEVGTCGNAYVVTIVGAGGETIDGQSTFVMCSNYESVKIYSDGAKLWVIPD